ncbi:hypothetical protein [Sediminibacillus halophilus]|uniref:hypothetical protein n=1 Tax=Sediminibacillus halophilus TaxID=482461 RepID=UPI0009440F5E|nr:hypothetical protein [Sediminibacillus halophilus]
MVESSEGKYIFGNSGDYFDGLFISFWLGIPFYYISGELTLVAPILFPLVSVLLFSAGLIYINLMAAKAMDDNKGQRSVYQWTLYFQFCTISISFFLLLIGYTIVLLSVNFSI